MFIGDEIMKKNISKIILGFCFGAMLVLLSACDGIGNNSKQGITVSGTITTNVAGESARTVTSSFSVGVDWTIRAEKGDSVQIGGFVDKNFTINLPSPGEWTISVEGAKSNGTKLLSGSKTVNVPATGASGISIEVEYQGSTGTGGFGLAIRDNTDRNWLNKIYVYEDIDNNGAVSREIRGCTEVENNNGIVYVSGSELSAGLHKLVFSFEDEAGYVWFSCIEPVNIYASSISDVWYGNSPYLRTNNDGSVEFVIEKEVLDSYPGYPVMLYSYDSNDGYNISLDDGESLPANVINYAQPDAIVDSCFDKNGNIYISHGDAGGYPAIFTTNPLVTNNNVYWKSSDNNYICPDSIAFDSVKEQLYVWDISGTGQFICLTDFTKTGTLDSSKYVYYSIENWDSETMGQFIVNDGVIYAVIINEDNEPTLNKIVLSTENPGASENNFTVSLEPLELVYDDGEGVTSINDIFYIAGYVYLLVTKEVNTYDTLRIPYGGMVIIDVDNNQTEEILFPGVISVNNIGFRQPSSLESKNAFFCPRKIIGIKPKKLVISDDGYFFYSEGSGKYKNANRVVTVDLDSFEIENVVIPTDTTFDENYTTTSGIDISAIVDGTTVYATFYCAD